MAAPFATILAMSGLFGVSNADNTDDRSQTQPSSPSAASSPADSETIGGAASVPATDIDYLAYKVAEQAEAALLSKVKWVLWILALVVTVVGLRAWYDYRTALASLDERIDTKLEKLIETKHQRMVELEHRMSEQYTDSVVNVKLEATRQLDDVRNQSKDTVDQFRTLAAAAQAELDRYKQDVAQGRREIAAIVERERVLAGSETGREPSPMEIEVFGPVGEGFTGMLASAPDSAGADAFIEGEYYGAFHHFLVQNMREQVSLGFDVVSSRLAFEGTVQKLSTGQFSQVPIYVGGDWRIDVKPDRRAG